ncbi:hypothetical protein SARC_03448 [Sphaeroforma arctica JP610]|uniref:Uncharacterized protein n=1 Tax=Sphaeroforma arctica JP610 TaxID=667725 RepID=A0A0L0G5U3_9EUKA|nr:hypothetical protein SARC_03448 [Sphaeroforma arctica JP610]KNC84324.1 hypothetical protein SARC_03448 [Sphaeroforma arctica JP610]|eukprot:XP_014158226.1 hypothetical protein SARC_03448 [Sphaeroforma arctica JP610]
MKQISAVKRRIGRTKPVPQVAPYDNVHISRRDRILQNAQKWAKEIPTPEGMSSDFGELAPYDTVHASRRGQMLNYTRNRSQAIPTPEVTPIDFGHFNRNQESSAIVISPGGFFLDPADLHLNMATPQNLSSSAKQSIDAFCRVMESPHQQPTNGQVVENLFRDKLQHRRRPQSIMQMYLSIRLHIANTSMFIIEDPQDVKRCKMSPPTEACITESTAAEMKTPDSYADGHRALQKERAYKVLLEFNVENEQKLQPMSFQDATAHIVRTHEQDQDNNAYKNILACMKLNPSVPLETQLQNFERKVDFMEMDNMKIRFTNIPQPCHTQQGGAPPHRASAVGTSTRTQQAPGINFRPRVNLMDGVIRCLIRRQQR